MTVLNFNIGVLGHVDSGKTSLAKALSTVASTACFDKNPQSKERGITLDLGFSSFTVDAPSNFKLNGYESVQYTLVDCPGHASLIRTIIGGAQIIDMAMLVIDIVKGIQTQTAECLIIAEITCNKLIIVLNKLDLIEQSKRETTIEKMTKRLHKTLENTKFAQCPVVALAANPSVNNSNENDSVVCNEPIGISNFIEKLKELTFIPNRNANGPFLFAIDHCFNIKGQGTVMTGTLLNGQVRVNDTIEIPALKVQKKVKSMQMFRKPIEQAVQGDRLGICVTNFDAKLIERGIACMPDYAKTSYGVIIKYNKIKHYKHNIQTNSHIHITIGHETIVGKIEIFADFVDNVDALSKSLAKTVVNDEQQQQQGSANSISGFNFNKEYIFVNTIDNETPNDTSKATEQASDETNNLAASNYETSSINAKNIKDYYLLIDFSDPSIDSSVLCTPNSLVIGSKLDADIHINQCRIAFYGNVLHSFLTKDYRNNGDLSKLKIYKEKFKEGTVERMVDGYSIIGKSLFKKETNMDLFTNLKVKLSTGEQGLIEGNFGQSGKIKIRIPNGLSTEAQEILSGNSKSKKKSQDSNNQPQTTTTQIKIFLNFKKFIFESDKKKIFQ